MSTDPPSDERLADRIDETAWNALAPHARRSALFFVSPTIGIEVAGRAIAANRSAVVAQWIATGLLRRPTPDETSALDRAPEATRLRFLIVQPYVLVEEPSAVEA